MNLISDPWIPVVMPDGTKEDVSLRDAFGNALSIRDLACNPPQRIALMRFLICITQAGLDGPKDEEDWFKCKDRIASAALKYLEEWKASFELFGEHPFMQIPGLTVAAGKSKPLDEIDCRFARGNMSVLFDHEATPDGRDLPHGQLAMALLTLLNFSPDGRVGQCIWNGVSYSHSTFVAPCLNHAVTLIRGGDLLSTIHFNLMTKNGQFTGVSFLPNGVWGKPVWECFPSDINDDEAFNNAGCTYLGRLVPLSRFVNLTAESPNRCIIGPGHKIHKIDTLPAFREPWDTIVLRRNQETYLRLDETKHMWREFGSLVSLRQPNSGNGGSMSICNLRTFFNLFPDQTVDVWVGGLKSKSHGKFVDTLECVFSVNLDLLHEEAMNTYLSGVKLAEEGESILRKAVRTCFAALKVEATAAPTSRARQRFWGELDRQCNVLVKTAKKVSVHLGDEWYGIVLAAAKQAYAESCPHQTPRQIEAYAQGLDKLKLIKPKE